MHVSPADFRSVRRGDITVRFAVLGEMAYALAELPNGSTGTSLEEPCERPHWGFVIDGRVSLETDEGRIPVPPATAFHVPAGLRHRIFVEGRARVAGFEPLDPAGDISDERLRDQGFEVLGPVRTPGSGLIIPAVRSEAQPAEPGEIATRGTLMGHLVFCQTRFGPRSGYASVFCDLAHWGLVTAGNIAIEWEEDVEVLASGDVFYCPAGPPGHKVLAADPASIIDFTPLAQFDQPGRIMDWRLRVVAKVRRSQRGRRAGVEVAPLG